MSSSVILCNNNKPFLDLIVMWDEKWILYDNQWWLAQWLDWEEAPKLNLHQKGSWSWFGGLLPVWYTTAFWIPMKTSHLRSMLSKSMRCTDNFNAYNRKGQFLLHDNAWLHFIQATVQKLNELSYEVLHYLSYYADFSPANCHFFKHLDNFVQGKCFHNQQDDAQNAFQEFKEFWGMDFFFFCYRNKQYRNKLISHWQKCIDCNGSYSDE